MACYSLLCLTILLHDTSLLLLSGQINNHHKWTHRTQQMQFEVRFITTSKDKTRESGQCDFWQRVDKQHSFSGPKQLCSFQSRTDSIFSIHHPME